jgi:hypothetical protein
MSQHDYNIANATFPNVRTDLNNALGAIATNNSGDSAPSTTYANQFWYETDTNKLYIRNEDNDAWIHILTLNQTNDTVSSVEGAAILAGIDDQSSSNDDQITITDTAVIINEDSDDVDFRVESNALTHAFFIDGGTDHVSIGNSSTSLYTLDIKQNGDFTGSDSDTANEAPLRVTSTHSNGRGAIAFGNNNNGVFNKGVNDLAIQGYNSVTFDVSTTNDDKFGTKTERFRISSSGKLATGAETDPDVDAGGLCLNQGADDGRILTFKSSDVAHGVTNDAETDTFLSMQKASATKGGVVMKVLAEDMDSEVYTMNIINTTDLTTTKSRTGLASVIVGVNKKGSGTATTFVNDDGNLFCVRNYIQTKFIVDADGELHADGSATVGTFDSYEDAQLVRAFDLSHMKGVINSKFDEYVKYKHEDLAEAGIVGREEDGTPNHMINVTGMQRLHNGAIWQQYEKTERLTQAMYELAKVAVGEDKANEILEQNEIKLLN